MSTPDTNLGGGGRSRSQRLLETHRPALGLARPFDYSKGCVILEPGDLLLGYTDGVTEARSHNGALFSRQRLLALLTGPIDSASGLIQVIKNRLEKYVGGATQGDDITMIAVRRTSARPRPEHLGQTI